MVWYYPYEKKERDEIRRIIRRDDLFAAWMLTTYATTDWQWCRIHGWDGERGHHIEFVRDCSEAEKEALNALLWSAQICMRVVRVKEGNPWAIACID